VALASLFGFTGAHCFLTKRWIRGTYIVVAILMMIVGFIVFPISIDSEADAVVAHPFRYAFDSVGLFFPADVFGVVALCLWVWDWFAIMFGWYKYPVFVDIDSGKKAQAGDTVAQADTMTVRKQKLIGGGKKPQAGKDAE
jgi:hypothetical protein